MTRLKETYQNEIVKGMTDKFGYKNVMQVPKLAKIVINMGVGEAKENSKVLDAAVAELEIIAGQKVVTTKAKNSVANFKIREGMPIGCKVTLRGDKMYEFLDRLVNLALPRVRDFRGVNPNAFDGRGNYALGIKEQLIFPEIEYDKVDKVRGMDIIFVTTANSDEEAKELLAEARAEVNKAHHFQTNLIQAEANGSKNEISVLLIHSQDHLMNGMTVLDMAGEFIDLYERIK